MVTRWVLARIRNETFFSLEALNERIDELVEELNDRDDEAVPEEPSAALR